MERTVEMWIEYYRMNANGDLKLRIADIELELEIHKRQLQALRQLAYEQELEVFKSNQAKK